MIVFENFENEVFKASTNPTFRGRPKDGRINKTSGAPEKNIEPLEKSKNSHKENQKSRGKNDTIDIVRDIKIEPIE